MRCTSIAVQFRAFSTRRQGRQYLEQRSHGNRETPFRLDGYKFVACPSRNSLPFQDSYEIPEADTVVRGSLGYEGNPTFVKTLVDLGWLDTKKEGWLKTGLTGRKSCRKPSAPKIRARGTIQPFMQISLL